MKTKDYMKTLQSMTALNSVRTMHSIKGKLIMTIVSASVISVLCVGGFFIYTILANSAAQIKEYRQSLQDSVDRELKTETEVALGAVQTIYAKQQAGVLTEEQAKMQAAELVRNMRYDDGKGYFWIDTYDGINVVLLGRDTEGKSRIDAVDPNGRHYIKEMIENGRKAGGGYTDLMFPKPNEQEPLPKRNYTMNFEPYKWVIGTGIWIDYIDGKVAQQEVYQNQMLKSSIIKILLYMVLLQIVLIVGAVYISRTLANPIRFVTQKMDILAGGDFGEDIDGDILERKDEIGIMGRSLKKLRDNMRTLLQKIAESAEYLAASSEQLTSSSEQSATASHQVADSMVNVANLCSDQFTAVEGAGKRTSELSTHMQDFMNAIEESGRNIKNTNDTAKAGNEKVAAAIEKMSRIKESVGQSAEVIKGLGEESKKIGVIVDTIGNIAGQTNLLALNAAIEAARAGEHGKGFAVVAEEVRKLAEQSQTAAAEIAGLIGSIQKESQNAVDVMQSGVSQVEDGVGAVDNAGNSFADIVNMVKQVAEKSSAMEKIVNGLAEGAGEISTEVKKIDTMSRSVSSEAETVSAATEEQTASMNEIADSSKSLAEMAQDLQNAVNKFKI
ncbi:methyl-accepting chemotaxis protein [Pectinatus frisingensis]|uniref:methyl-accepting chemotaxis protein n=2 Tax=Pectinatus frisingensis TaxID=865 RepID=UPI001E57F921|nr:methyl-accepting chemotaxis protein [Pectinatus frisingensis]